MRVNEEDGVKELPRQAKGGGARYVYETLKTEILCLDLAPGTPLDETTLAHRFSMSRSPVREALVRLSADGLVKMLSNRSTLVSPVDLTDFPRYVEALDLQQRVNTRLAAKHRSVADIDNMLAQAKAFDEAVRSNDYLSMSATNRDFHMAVAEAGRNPYLSRCYGALLDEGRRFLHMHFDYLESSSAEELLTPEHYDIVDAIKEMDVERADRLAHQHTRQFHDRFMNFMRANYLTDFDLEPSPGL